MTNLTAPRTELASLPSEYLGQGHTPRKLASAAWSVAGYLVIAAMMIGALLAGRELADIPGGFFIRIVGGLLFGTVMGVAQAKCWIHSKRLRTPSALEILARDPRPPVVYFRPFTADGDASKPVILGSWFTEEEQLAKMMNDIGPLIAIGAPEETLPLLGAARLYVDDPKWHETALALVERAAVIIMRIGNSSGFWWEFESVARQVRPERLVLLIPRDQVLYEEFRLASRELIPTVLPTLTGWDIKKRLRGTLRAVIFFDTAWVPTIVDVQTYRLPWLRRSPTMPLVPVLKTALRPMYERVGLPWTAPGINGRMVFLLGAAAFFVVAQVLLWGIEGGPALPSLNTSWAPATDPAPPPTVPEPVRQSAAEIAMERFSNRLQEVPEILTRMEAISAAADPGADGRTRARQSAQAMGAQLADLGMKRLDDDALLTMATLQTKLMMQADVAGCAAIVRGTASGRLMTMLASLDATEIDQFFELVYQAAVAEARQTPAAREADQGRLQETMSIILNDLPETEREHLRNALTKGAGDDDEETCWMGRTLRAGIGKLDRADRVQWMLVQ